LARTSPGGLDWRQAGLEERDCASVRRGSASRRHPGHNQQRTGRGHRCVRDERRRTRSLRAALHFSRVSVCRSDGVSRRTDDNQHVAVSFTTPVTSQVPLFAAMSFSTAFTRDDLAQRSNLMGYPMDCPQRDERLGWFGDALVSMEEAMFNFDMPVFTESGWMACGEIRIQRTATSPSSHTTIRS